TLALTTLAPALATAARPLALAPDPGDAEPIETPVQQGLSVRLDADGAVEEYAEPPQGFTRERLVDGQGRPAGLPFNEGRRGAGLGVWAVSVKTLDSREIAQPRRELVRGGIGVLGISATDEGGGETGRARVLVGKPVEAHEMVVVTLTADVKHLLGRPLERAVLQLAQRHVHTWAFTPDRPETAGWSARLLQRIADIILIDPASGFTTWITVPPATRTPHCLLFGNLTSGTFHLRHPIPH
ncbi:hypothetical protein, partial [Actinocorallia lasiicapitis]